MQLKLLAMQCVGHLAYIQDFESEVDSQKYLNSFIEALNMFFKIPAMQQYVLTERQLYTEFVQVMAKLQSNFGMHKLARL